MTDYDILKEENERLLTQLYQSRNSESQLIELNVCLSKKNKDLVEENQCLQDSNSRLTQTINELLSEAEDKVRLG